MHGSTDIWRDRLRGIERQEYEYTFLWHRNTNTLTIGD